MATRRGNRVTTVSPFTVGADSHLADAFPLNRKLFILLKLLTFLVYHWQLTLFTLLFIALSLTPQLSWRVSLLIICALYTLKKIIRVAWLYWNNPNVPLLAWKKERKS